MAGITDPRGLDPGVQGQHIGHPRNTPNLLDEQADEAGRSHQGIDSRLAALCSGKGSGDCLVGPIHLRCDMGQPSLVGELNTHHQNDELAHDVSQWFNLVQRAGYGKAREPDTVKVNGDIEAFPDAI